LIAGPQRFGQLSGIYARAGKRVLDIGLAVIALPPVMLLLPPTWLAATLSTGASGLFSQERIGRRFKPFKIWKLRTMRVRAEASDSFAVSVSSDSRITRVGRLFRQSKLDEFPQIWNVLRGDMSVVGPRPEVPRWVEALAGEFQHVITVRPGITGLASLVYRDEEGILAHEVDPVRTYRDQILPRKLRLNRLYADNVSLRLDLTIIALTLFGIVFPARSKLWAEGIANNLENRAEEEPLRS
jgi:lipopolysaccharide/colanic/teichoic acid biosynthesis glycosyltransferase